MTRAIVGGGKFFHYGAYDGSALKRVPDLSLTAHAVRDTRGIIEGGEGRKTGDLPGGSVGTVNKDERLEAHQTVFN